MRRLLPLTLPLALMTLLVAAPPSLAESSARPDRDDPTAIELLRRAAIAHSVVAYGGTQYITAWNTMRPEAGSDSAIVEVDHNPGEQASMWRRGGARVDVGGGDGAPIIDTGSVDRIAESYQVVLARPGSVAGRDTDVVHAYRADGSQAAAMWLDAATGLMLRRELYEPSGTVVSASSFVEISVQTPECCSHLVRWVAHATPQAESGSLADSRAADVEALREEGWHCPSSLGDGMRLHQVRRHGDTVQLSYSDGLVSVSVFEQRGRLDPDQLGDYEKRDMGGGTVWVDSGTPPRVLWSTGDHVVTVVTDAPQQSVDAVLATKPPVDADATEQGWGNRVLRGGKRLVSWLNPFD